MAKYPSNLVAGLLSASAALTGLALSAPCSGGGCHSCFRCAGVGAAVIVTALCCRGRRPTTNPAERPEPANPVDTPAAIIDLR